MKKLPLLIICIALAAVVLAGCAAPSPTVPEATEAPFSVRDAEIFESSHQRDEAFPSYFKTHALETPFFTVHMDDGIYEEDALRAAAEKLLADVETACGRTGSEPGAFSVYVRGKLLPDNPSAAGNSVFITADELETGAYRRALLKAAYGLAAEWQSVGLEGFVFEEEIDESGLKEYYSDPANALAPFPRTVDSGGGDRGGSGEDRRKPYGIHYRERGFRRLPFFRGHRRTPSRVVRSYRRGGRLSPGGERKGLAYRA